ncbi:MAG: S-layer homology domain-containing protein, partial [Clostridiales Family XIII bacterium]|nr:S-layer homology domain-containing protein [Clostridiales Family XIII bacterium]
SPLTGTASVEASESPYLDTADTDEVTYSPNLKVKDVPAIAAFIADGYIFAAAETVLNYSAAGQEFVGTRDSQNSSYATERVTVAVTVNKAESSIVMLPEAGAIKAGQKLSGSMLTGGESSVGGTFAWANPDEIAGATGEHDAIFTPSDSNYAPFDIKITVTVTPASSGGGGSAKPAPTPTPAPAPGPTVPEPTPEPAGPSGKVPPGVSEKIQETLETVGHFGYINGYSDGTVKPDGAITRAEVAKIFFSLIRDTAKNSTAATSFADVADGAWYSQAVNYLAEHEILKGYHENGQSVFKPEQNITRAEFAAIAARLDDLLAANNAFADVASDHWAIAFISSAAGKGWINGYPDGTFRPSNDITRAEVVTVANKMTGRKLKTGEPSVNPYSDLASSHWAFADILEASAEHDYDRDENWFEIWK